jgi:hypothetical protein
MDDRAKITQQFRERANMAYELDCAGTKLTVRVFPIETTSSHDQWRIDARTTDAADAVVATATAPTRAQAFHEVATWWRANGVLRRLPPLDWEAIARAMASVRAL